MIGEAFDFTLEILFRLLKISSSDDELELDYFLLLLLS
jgi:hypothetical protein